MYRELIVWIKALLVVRTIAIAPKNIVAKLNKSEKMNGDNYYIWSMKIQYVLEEQEALEVLNMVMTKPK